MLLQGSEQDVNVEYKHQGRERATLTYTTSHGEAVEHRATRFDPTLAVKVESLDHIDDFMGKLETSEHIHETLLRDAGEGRFKVEEDHSTTSAGK